MKNLIFFLLLTVQWLLFAESPIVYYHIPKTAGSTFTFLLEDRFPAQLISPALYNYAIEDVTQIELEKYELLCGHVLFSSKVSNIKNATNITVLRDPVERVLCAQRYYVQYFKGRDPEAVLRSWGLSPGDPIDTINNQACMYLSSFSPDDVNVSIEKHLASAKQNLQESFFFIGFTEDLGNSIHTLFDLLGWDRLNTIPYLQSSDLKLENIDERILNDIREKNWADIELYNFARQLMTQKIEEYKKNNLFKPKFHLFLDSFHFSALDALPGEGWSHRQKYHQFPHRRINPKGFSFFYLYLKDSVDYQITVKAVLEVGEESKFQIHLNGHELLLDKHDPLMKGGVTVFKGIIPAYWIKEDQRSVLEFSFETRVEDTKKLERIHQDQWDRVHQDQWVGIVEVDIQKTP